MGRAEGTRGTKWNKVIASPPAFAEMNETERVNA